MMMVGNMKKTCYIAIMAIIMAFTVQAEAGDFNHFAGQYEASDFDPFAGQYEASKSNGFSGNIKERDSFQPYIGVGVGIFSIGYQEPGLSQSNSTWGSFIKAGVDITEEIGFELRIGTTGKTSNDWSLIYPGLKLATKINYFASYLLKLGVPTCKYNNNHIHLYVGGTTAKYTAAAVVPGFPNQQIGSTRTAFTYGLGYDLSISDTTSLGIEWMEYWRNVTFDNSGGAASLGSFRSLSTSFKMLY